jgi:hypothetical protein
VITHHLVDSSEEFIAFEVLLECRLRHFSQEFVGGITDLKVTVVMLENHNHDDSRL